MALLRYWSCQCSNGQRLQESLTLASFRICVLVADSEYCAPGCPLIWVGDGICDTDCYNSAACEYDAGDCQAGPTLTPTPLPTGSIPGQIVSPSPSPGPNPTPPPSPMPFAGLSPPPPYPPSPPQPLQPATPKLAGMQPIFVGFSVPVPDMFHKTKTGPSEHDTYLLAVDYTC